MAWSDDRYTAARVRKLRVERALATDTLAPTGHAIPAAQLQAAIDADIRRALVGDSHDTGRTSRPTDTRTTSVQTPASRGLTLVGKANPEAPIEPVCTQGAPVSMSNVRRESELDRAAAVRERIAEREAKRAERRARKRRY